MECILRFDGATIPVMVQKKCSAAAVNAPPIALSGQADDGAL